MMSSSNGADLIKKKTNKNTTIHKLKHPVLDSSSLLSSTASSVCTRKGGGFNVSNRNRNPRRRPNQSDVVGALALPTGMAIAAVLSQVMEQKDATEDRMSVDHLTKIKMSEVTLLLTYSAVVLWTGVYLKHLAYREIFTLAVKESLTNVFGDKYGCFVNNFEKSFQSTLMTLRSVHESSQIYRREYYRESKKGKYCSDPSSSTSPNREENTLCDSCENYYQPEAVLNTINNLEEPNTSELNKVNMQPNIMNRGLSLPNGYINQQLTYSSNNLPPLMNGSMHNLLEKSVVEQVRSNDLKTFEIGLVMKKMQQKDAQIALSSDLNSLERFKLSMGVSKASFRAEKFKTELKDARYAELLKTCIDCLVAGLFIMLAALAYATYVYSHQRIIEATASCATALDSKSWWIPKPVSSISSGLHTLRCQAQVVFRMLFGVLLILSIAFLLLQRTGSSQQAMPVTFILLLLGVACGFAGKFCIDTLGGSGNHWLLYWEALCLLHFFSSICTPALYIILNGPIIVTGRSRGSKIFPLWMRRFLFYSTTLVILPLLCGFMPFAGFGEWRDHFSSLILDRSKLKN